MTAPRNTRMLRVRARELPRALAIAAALMVTACTVGPDYVRPAIEAPVSWRVTPQDLQPTLDSPWWQQFGDPVLDDLIGVALAENNDIRIAAARVDQYLGALGATRSQLYQQVGAAFDASRQRTSRETGVQTLPASVDPTFSYFQPGVQVSWEIDLWGRVRRATEAARADVLANENARQAVVLSLVMQVTNTYIQLRDLDRQLEIAQGTAKSRAESLRVFDLRFKGGVVSEMELAQAQAEYDGAVATIPSLQQQIASTENALSILLGRTPGPIARGKTIDALVAPAIPEGLPSSLLQRRPDIRQAEQQLVSANAQIGVARAAYYPAIALTGSLGTASTSLSRLFTSQTLAWSLAAGLTQPIFNAGLISGQVAQTEAVQQQALFSYRKAVQQAFADVDNALTATVKSREQLVAVSRSMQALQTYARLARLRYDNGYTSYLEVTDAESKLFEAQLNYAQTQQLVLSGIVSIYASMGGGWVDIADRGTPTSIAKTPPLTERERELPLF
jgi:multidrug efflux system outer membrane protein